jgi:ATP-dependent DNA ligase
MQNLTPYFLNHFLVFCQHFDIEIFVLEFEPLKNLKKSMEKSAKKGYEGVILKELNSKYQISYQAPMPLIIGVK